MWPSAPFTGRYYGNGYTVSNLTQHSGNAIISNYCPPYDSSGHTVALIGMFAATDGAILHELVLENANISYSGSPSTHNSCIVFASAITALSADTSFYGCSVIDSEIDVYHSIPQVSGGGYTAQNDIGSFIAFAWGRTVIDNGFVEDISINSYVRGDEGWFDFLFDTKRENPLVGGLIGHLSNSFSITDCYISGNITSNADQTWVCGVVGHVNDYDAYADEIQKTGITYNMYINGETTSVGSRWVSTDSFYTLVENPDKIYSYHILHEGDDPTLVNGYAYEVHYEKDIHNTEFIYGVAGYDPMMWKIIDNKIVKTTD